MDIKNLKIVISKKDEKYCQLLSTFEYEKIIINKTIFIKIENGRDDEYYLKQATLNFEQEKQSLKLEKYCQKYIKKLNRKPILENKILIGVSMACVVSLVVGGGFLINYLVNKDNCLIKIINEDEKKGDIRNGGVFKRGSNILLEAKPKDGYLFTAWYKIVNDTELFISSNKESIFKVEENATIKAKWENYSTQSFNFEFDSSTSEFSISSYRGDDLEVIVPTTHLGASVTTIKPYTFSYKCQNNASIKVNEGINKINNSAFKDCFASNCYLPTSLKTVDDFAFENWSSSQTIYISKDSIKQDQEGIFTSWKWKLDDTHIGEGYYLTKDRTCGLNQDVHIKVIE